MLPKIIAIDLDGTLLDKYKKVSEITKNYLNFLEQIGHLIVLCSQNSIDKMKEIKKELNLHSPLICQAGSALIFESESENVILGIPVETVHEFFRLNNSIIKNAFYKYENELYIYNRDPKLEFFYEIKENTIIHEIDFKKDDMLYPNTIMVVIDSKRRNDFEDSLNKYSHVISNRFLGADLNDAIYYLNLKNVDKSYALLELLMKYNLKPSDIMAIGDSSFDVPMLKLGIGVSMINGEDDCKKASKYITEFDNNHDGVYHFLKKFNEENIKK